MTYIISIFAIAGWIALVISIAIFCKKIWPYQKELSRKIVHIGTGPVIPMAWWLQIPADIAICAASLITIALIINKRFTLIQTLEDIKRDSFGTIAYGVSITFLLTLYWPENAAAVCAGVLVMAVGDGLAGLIGRNTQSPSWIILGQRKSIAGTLTMSITTMIVLILISISINAHLNPIRILAVTILAVALEQISKWGSDNLTVPIGIALTWSWMITI